jgi:hypothetical protein
LRVPEINLKEKKVIIYEARRRGRKGSLFRRWKEVLTSWFKARDPKKDLVLRSGEEQLNLCGSSDKVLKYIEKRFPPRLYDPLLRHTFAANS